MSDALQNVKFRQSDLSPGNLTENNKNILASKHPEVD